VISDAFYHLEREGKLQLVEPVSYKQKALGGFTLIIVESSYIVLQEYARGHQKNRRTSKTLSTEERREDKGMGCSDMIE
jgi:hypothetical protein